MTELEHPHEGVCSGQVRRLLQTKTAFSFFLFTCMSGGIDPDLHPVTGLWPCPPPYAWAPGPSPPSKGRKTRGVSVERRVQLAVNLMVVSLSFLRLGSRRFCPAEARSGMPLNEAQNSMVSRVRELARSWCRGPLQMGERGRKKLESLLEFGRAMRDATLGGIYPAPPPLAVQPLVAARAKYMKEEQHFCPTPWLPVFEAATYVEPRLLERRPPADHGLPPMKQPGELAELVRFAEDLDRHGKLHLARPDEVAVKRGCRLIPVYRDAARDRVVWDRRIQNAHEHQLRSASQRLVGGAALTDYELAPGAEPVIYAADLSDFYPAFDSSVYKARTNVLARVLPSEALAHLRAFRRRKGALGDRAVICVQGLLMGDTNAIDYAHGAHEALLQQAGSLPDAARVFHHRPFPRTPEVELLQIDDHVGMGQRPAHSAARCPVLDASFAAARSAYASDGLRVSASKDVAAQAGGVVLGTEVLRSGWCGAERLRRAGLSLCSEAVAAGRQATGALLRRLLAQWVHCLEYRRPMMCLLHRAYQHLPPLEQDDVVTALPAAVRQELSLLAALAPAMSTDLHAAMSDTLVCSDASLHSLAAVHCAAPREVVREVWRRRQRRGYYTRITPAGLEYLRAKKLLESRSWLQDMDEELLPEMRVPQWRLLERFDFIEVCCGPDAPLSGAMAAAGLAVGPCIDLKRHAMWDLTSGRVLEWLVFMAGRRRVWYVHCGAPCTTFSIARHPALRSRAQPMGFDPQDPTTALGNAVLLRSLVVLLALYVSGLHGSHEHPATAYSWWAEPVQRLFAMPGNETVEFSACMYGAPYRKDTRLGVVRCPQLRALERRCVHKKHELRLEGGHTQRAAAYHADLCTEWARVLAAARREDSDPTVEADDEEAAITDGGGRMEQPFVNDIVASGEWKLLAVREGDPALHINVLEVRAANLAIRNQASQRPHLRQPYLLDSAVAVGCLAKGRSASSVLNRELLRGLPVVVGYDHYPGFDFVPTRLNPSDDPTRQRRIRTARRDPPDWLLAAAHGDLSGLLAVAALPRQRRAYSEWARLTAALRAAELGVACGQDEPALAREHARGAPEKPAAHSVGAPAWPTGGRSSAD